MTLFHSLILGLVEGFTEFLPISSTGHMVLVSHFFKMQDNASLATFEIVSQVGAIAAVAVLYFKKLFEIKMIKKLIIAFIPTGVIGLVVFPHIKAWLQNPLLVAFTMTIGGICILFVENWYEKKEENEDILETNKVTYKQAFLLGLYQAIAVIPGVSRSGAMIIGGLTMKLPRKVLTEFTFLLAVPTMVIATLYTLYKKHSELAFTDIMPIAFGTLISFVVALFVIKYFLAYIRSHSFKIFGWYRIVIGVILLVVLW
jgi:undecaprenyl-diphosphatase